MSRELPEHPAEGIDAFLSTHRNELKIMRVGYQLFVKRTATTFRGFEWNDAEGKVLESAVATGGAVWTGRVQDHRPPVMARFQSAQTKGFQMARAALQRAAHRCIETCKSGPAGTLYIVSTLI